MTLLDPERIGVRRADRPVTPRLSKEPAVRLRGCWPLALPVLLAALLETYQLTRPGALLGVTSWDDGAYLGQVLRLLDGVMPYQRYPVAEPPGLMVLLAPLVAVARLGGTDTALGAVRIMTAAVDVANVALLGVVLRHRRRIAAGCAMTMMALYPAMLAASATLLLEPYLDLFCLLSMVVLFPRGQLAAGRRRLVLGGVLLGIAGTIKIFAIFPFVALLGFLAWRHRRAISSVVSGTAGGFAAVCLPFFVMAPGSFLRQVVYVQVFRTTTGRTPSPYRISTIVGLSDVSLSDGAVVMVGLLLAALVIVAIIRVRRRMLPVDLFCAASSVIILGALLLPTTFMSHYAAFLAPYLFVVIAALIPATQTRLLGRGLTSLLVSLFAVAMLIGDLIVIAGSLPLMEPSSLPVPPGACVVSDSPVYPIVLDRFSTRKGCPVFVDTFGATMVWSGAEDPQVVMRNGQSPSVGRWERLLGQADYFVQSDWPWPAFPETRSFEQWFHGEFVLVGPLPRGGGSLYRNRRDALSASSRP